MHKFKCTSLLSSNFDLLHSSYILSVSIYTLVYKLIFKIRFGVFFAIFV